jgi:hypothetical protein
MLSARRRTPFCWQVVIVRHSLSAPLSQVRYGASGDREADTSALRARISTRRHSEVLFTDGKEERGLDHFPLMSAHALVRFRRTSACVAGCMSRACPGSS